jgi:phosphoserine phosphatase
MDGTLLRGSACIDLSHKLGHGSVVDAMEVKWAQGQLGQSEYYELLLPLWAELNDSLVEEVFLDASWIPGIVDVWADIAARGETTAVVTLSPQFFAERLLRWGATSVHGAVVQAGSRPDPLLVLTADSKIGVVRDLIAQLRLEPAACVVYGDSDADIPLFKHLSKTIAVNATPALKNVAAASYDGWNLQEAYTIGRQLLDSTP